MLGSLGVVCAAPWLVFMDCESGSGASLDAQDISVAFGAARRERCGGSGGGSGCPWLCCVGCLTRFPCGASHAGRARCGCSVQGRFMCASVERDRVSGLGGFFAPGLDGSCAWSSDPRALRGVRAARRLRGRFEQEKGIWWMPWHQEAMKDVARCEKPGGAASRL